MFKSKEIRWFSRQENKSISKWFAGRGQTFDSIDARTDHYLVSLNHEDIAAKLREGNIEIKHRVNQSFTGQLIPGAEGRFEEYTKWSFKLNREDTAAKQIIDQNKYPAEWLQVYKERMGIKLAKEPNGSIKIHDIKDMVNNACQIEYTLIKVKDEVWYSFNLEWYGNEFIKPDPELLQEMIGDESLELQDSMGYGEFLKRRV